MCLGRMGQKVKITFTSLASPTGLGTRGRRRRVDLVSGTRRHVSRTAVRGLGGTGIGCEL